MPSDYFAFQKAILNTVNLYRENCAAFFQYLEEKRREKLSPAQFEFYRVNYFARTSGTIPSICLVVKAAAENEDEATLKSAGQNLSEELGLMGNNSKKSHAELLRFSHNKHGEVIFNLSPISFKEALSSDLVTNETRQFRQIQSDLYNSKRYVKVLAANYAQEQAAVQMLDGFLNAFFLPYSAHYADRQQFGEVLEYFDCHLSGIEERHAEDAELCLYRQCKSQADINLATEAIGRLLTAQANMWHALQKGMKKSEKVSEIALIDE